jgi:alpha-glucosidase
MSNSEILYATKENAEWWRSAVIYQIYPRSFADGNGDGMGDLKGVTARLDSLVDLGIDAIWFSPFMLSPQKDAGYDITDYKQIDPLFGNLDDFDEMLKAANAKGIRIIVDMVPNHSSDQNALFQAALKAGPGSPERDMYIFRDGKGFLKRKAPNNWPSVFGGSTWTRIREANGKKGQFYLHIFDSSQPDFNWENPKVQEYFNDILRFWLDRGVAGFRVDVAHGLIKRAGLPDTVEYSTEMGGAKGDDELTLEELERKNPYWGQPAVHEINRKFRKVIDSYDDRIMAGEAWIMPLTRMAEWVRKDEYHQAFNFDYMFAAWSKEGQKRSITDSLKAFGHVGAPSTWVLSNHDVIRHATRLA